MQVTTDLLKKLSNNQSKFKCDVHGVDFKQGYRRFFVKRGFCTFENRHVHVFTVHQFAGCMALDEASAITEGIHQFHHHHHHKFFPSWEMETKLKSTTWKIHILYFDFLKPDSLDFKFHYISCWYFFRHAYKWYCSLQDVHQKNSFSISLKDMSIARLSEVFFQFLRSGTLV